MTNVLHRAGTANYNVTADGVRYAATKIGNTWYVAAGMEVIGDVATYAEAKDMIDTAIINRQAEGQEIAIAEGRIACYDTACLFAQGPICTCTCKGHGHQQGYTEIKF